MKKYMNMAIVIGILHLSYAGAQEIDTSFTKIHIDYATYMELIGKGNLEYSAKKFNTNIAEAHIRSARVFPDPELGFGYVDNGERRMKMGYGFRSELSWTLELGGKRRARIDIAKNEMQLTGLLLEDYFRNLRADATLAYLLTIQNRHLLDVRLSSFQQMRRLAEADSIRFKLGSITHVDARLSKLEAGMMLNDVYAAEAAWKASLTTLSLLLGQNQRDTVICPKEGFTGFDRNFMLHDLIRTAQNNRSDLQAALQHKNVSQSAIELAKANRAIDLGLTIGVDYNTQARNVIAPTPSFTAVNAGISIPLKFSNKNHGELRSAQYSMMQAEQLYKQTELTIQAEVTQAFYDYQAAQKQVMQFNTGLLAEANAILDGKTYSYQRGETSLLEVLDAQRNYNEIHQNYYQTLYHHAAKLVELERAVGVWDINF